MIDKTTGTKAFREYSELHAKGMKNIRKNNSGVHALDVSDNEIIELGGLSPAEQKDFLKYAKILEEYQNQRD